MSENAAPRLSPEEVAALWKSGQVRRWEDGTDLATPRGATHFDRGDRKTVNDFSMARRHAAMREQRRHRMALEALEQLG